MDTPEESLHARVFGRVQGVNFRAATRERAQALGLTGWVRNRPDGSVEVLAEGTRAALTRLLDYLHHGPRHAAVDRVEAVWRPASGGFISFEIRF